MILLWPPSGQKEQLFLSPGQLLPLGPAAIALHALVDAGAVLLQKSVGMVPLELIVTAEALAVAAIAYLVAQKR